MPKSKPLKTAQLDDQVGFKLRLAQLAVFSDIIEALKSFDLRPVDLSTLLLIEAHPGMRQHVVGDRLKIARPNVAALVDSLVKRQLIDRAADANDRRANLLNLTPQGEELLKAAKAAQVDHAVRISNALDGLDVDNFMRCLDRLAVLGR